MPRKPRTTKALKVAEEPAEPEAESDLAPPAPAPAQEPAEPPRKKRKLSDYNVFVRDRYSDPEIQALPVRARIRELGRLWQLQKSSVNK